MKIHFLGTGAADWPFDRESCNHKDYRRRSSTCIDNVLLIDPGPQVFDSAVEQNFKLDGVKYIINTHIHPDHYNEDTVRRLTSCGAAFADVKAGETVKLGKYEIRAFAANHACENTRHFLISDGEKSVFYALDSAHLLYEEATYLRSTHTDVAIMDATLPDIDGDYRVFEHNNIGMLLTQTASLKDFVGKFVFDHLCMLHESHKLLQENMNAHSILVAYDGMELDI